MGSDHPNVTLRVDNGFTAVAPKHIHHRFLERSAELYGLGNRLVRVFRQQRYKLVGEAPIVFAAREPI